MTFHRLVPLVIASLSVAMAACSEKLDSSSGCPELCPGQGIDVINTTIDGVVYDTTVGATAPFGSEPFMLLASRGDTLDSRVIIRFDSIPQRYRRVASDTTTTAITTVDSAYVQLRLELAERQASGPLTVSAYDVDTTANDTSVAALLPLFRADRLIGSQTFAAADLKDSVRVPLSGAAIVAKAQAKAPLRIGFRITGHTGQFHVRSLESGTPASLSVRVSPDTAVARLTFQPFSRTPENSADLQATLADFQLVVRTPPDGPLQYLLAGGIPPRRSYMQFVIPSSILDSSSVIRATLLLDQISNPGFGPLDTVLVVTHLGIGGKAITDPVLAATLIAAAEVTQIDSLRVAANASGTREIDIAPVLRVWRLQGDTLGPRALVLRSGREGASAAQAWFHGIESAAALRPRLRISYSPVNPFGLP